MNDVLGVPSKAVRLAWALHEALRRLGFSAEHIFVQAACELHTKKWNFYVILRLPEKPDFRISASAFEDENEADIAIEEWRSFVAGLGVRTDGELQDFWFEAFPTLDPLAALVERLRDRGFDPPSVLAN